MLFVFEGSFLILMRLLPQFLPSNTPFEVLHIAYTIGASVGYGGNGS